ncbi:tRNA guanosine-2-O-methyltransferase TRM13 [Trypanosoma grayi]|uniref:tRNA guanosine-2-O-methyltransferase TRM13 n=1 Tax=Trypanosoma grayi TaxID=71804 RepID=UPI0004F42932|nr:tRNA guanosine-2-O-methyltransferase TRM13 [Trypanosoma grayi]KEG09112.1 tRNA guanosine-2-O-methyltransferase TRM13 [Trypanosoma grayi]
MASDAESLPQRVPCPINPNHTVYASRLQHHVRVCPDLRFVASALPYYSQNTNAFCGKVYCRDEDVRHERLTHRDLDKATLDRLITRVREYYYSVVQPQIVLLAEEQCGADDDPVDQTRRLSSKHSPQHRGLLWCVEKALRGHIETLHEHGSDSGAIAGFVEFGAGKGGLSVALQDAISSGSLKIAGYNTEPAVTALEGGGSSNLRLLVVDVDNFRRKGDACVRRTSLPLIRLRLNIKDLDLVAALRDPSVRKRSREGVDSTTANSVETQGNSPATEERWVALGKHLCGSCTDFALSSVTSPKLHAKSHASVVAVVLATCCHHRCELQHLNALPEGGDDTFPSLRLPGTDYTISSAEFAAITSMSSWAVSGSFVDEQSRQTGVCCKRVIDALRVEYLRRKGYLCAYLCEYVGRDVTEENVCIVAFRSNTGGQKHV